MYYILSARRYLNLALVVISLKFIKRVKKRLNLYKYTRTEFQIDFNSRRIEEIFGSFKELGFEPKNSNLGSYVSFRLNRSAVLFNTWI